MAKKIRFAKPAKVFMLVDSDNLIHWTCNHPNDEREIIKKAEKKYEMPWLTLKSLGFRVSEITLHENVVYNYEAYKRYITWRFKKQFPNIRLAFDFHRDGYWCYIIGYFNFTKDNVLSFIGELNQFFWNKNIHEIHFASKDRASHIE